MILTSIWFNFLYPSIYLFEGCSEMLVSVFDTQSPSTISKLVKTPLIYAFAMRSKAEREMFTLSFGVPKTNERIVAARDYKIVRSNKFGTCYGFFMTEKFGENGSFA